MLRAGLCLLVLLATASAGDGFLPPVRIEAGGAAIDTDVGHAAPFVGDFDGDGVSDLLVGQFGGGVLWIFRNEGTNAQPKLAKGVKFKDGRPEGTVPTGWCVGFGPQLVDLDGDGHVDLLSGSWPGELFLFRGGPGRTFAAPEMLKDKEGEYINIGGGVEERPDGAIVVTGHGEFEENDGETVVSYHGRRIKAKPGGQIWLTGTASAVHAVDWDGDGDMDLLVGDIGGKVYLVPNEGKRGAPAYGKWFQLRTALFLPVEVAGDAGPFVADWDADGDGDLLVGSGDGSVALFRNMAPKGSPPLLAAPVELVPAGEVSYDENAPAEPTRGIRAKVCAADWNGDGLLDLLVGDFATQRPALPEPSPEEKAEHDRLRKELDRVTEVNGRLMDKLLGADRAPDAAEREKLEREFEAVQQEMRGLREKLPPEYQDHGWIWLFLRKPAEE